MITASSFRFARGSAAGGALSAAARIGAIASDTFMASGLLADEDRPAPGPLPTRVRVSLRAPRRPEIRLDSRSRAGGLAFGPVLACRVVSERVPPPRRRPKQARSQAIVKAIQEACLRILKEEGPDAVNTNRIAEVAGVNIASVYRYFPN